MTMWLELPGGVTGVWFPFLIDVALKGALVLLAAFALTPALRKTSASVRHHVWTLAFVAVLVLPVLAATLPSWQVRVAGWTSSRNLIATEALPTAAAVPADEILPLGDQASEAAGVTALRTSDVADVGRTPPGSIWEFVLFAWIAGAFLLLGRLMMGVVSAWWTSRVAVPIEDPGWLEIVAELKTRLGISGEIRVLRSSWVSTPMAWGILRPALLLPNQALSWPVDRRRAVLLHELAHVKRRDCLVHIVVHATRALHWMNPVAWIGARRIRTEREHACDDMVLRAGAVSADYAAFLLDVACHGGDRRLGWAAVAMARPSELEGRLLAILDPARERRALGRVGSLLACLFVAAMVLPLAAFQAAPTPTPDAGDLVGTTTSSPVPPAEDEPATAGLTTMPPPDVPAAPDVSPTLDRLGIRALDADAVVDMPVSAGEAQVQQVLQPSALCPDQPDAAIATFEDANLEAAVRAALSIGAQDDLTCGSVSGLTALEAERAGIESLLGIQNLTSLTELRLAGNSITDISAVNGLTSLTVLDLHDNAITDFSHVAGLTSLTSLRLEAGEQALIRAAGDGHADIVTLLLASGADVNSTDDTGETALMWASADGFADVVSLLLADGADANSASITGFTALMWAAGDGFADVVTLLLANGADVNSTNVVGGTALTYAAGDGFTNVVELLLANGAAVN